MLHPGAKALVLPTLLLAKALNLHQVGNHPYELLVFSVSREPDNGSVTDQLFLSIWLEQKGKITLLRQFEKLLRLFPFSQREEQPQSTVSILAVSSTEAPLLERPMNGPFDLNEVGGIFKEYSGSDVAYHVESWWDLWTYDGDWALRPSRVLLACFGPDFDNGTEQKPSLQEDIRVEFGVDTRYLPDPEIPASGRMVESNIKSLLRLVHEIDNTLPVSRRLLRTESGENFAERLEANLRESRVQ